MAVVPGTGTGSGALGQTAPFREYTLDHAYDEMFDAAGQARPQYAHLFERLLTVDPTELRQRQSAADLAFLNQGITFTVYGQKEGTERIFPYDLLPRILTSAEWDVIERGLTQRITALNLFLKDIYNEGRILAEGIVPRELIYSCRHYRREMRGVPVRRDVYVSVAGTDLVRLPDGRFAVLEDNLRVPSGVSYMLTNRQVIKNIFPTLFSRYDVRPVDQYGAGAAGDAAIAGAGAPPRSDDRAAHAGRLQLGVLRAHVPRAPDGHRAGRGARPRSSTTTSSTCGRPAGLAARGRHLPARGRRLPGPAGVPRGLAAGRGGHLQRVSAPATSRSPTPSAPASPTTRRSTPTCRRSSGSTWARSRSSPNIETWLLHRDEDRALRARSPRRARGEGGRRIRRLRDADRPAQHRGRARGVPRTASRPTRATTSRSRRWRCRGRPASSKTRSQARHVDLRPYILCGDRRHDRAGRPDARRAAQGLARRELVAGRRQQGHLGAKCMNCELQCQCSKCEWESETLRSAWLPLPALSLHFALRTAT